MDTAWEVRFILRFINISSGTPILFFMFGQVIGCLPGLSHYNPCFYLPYNAHPLIKDLRIKIQEPILGQPCHQHETIYSEKTANQDTSHLICFDFTLIFGRCKKFPCTNIYALKWSIACLSCHVFTIYFFRPQHFCHYILIWTDVAFTQIGISRLSMGEQQWNT
jgi:hypothetical protein